MCNKPMTKTVFLCLWFGVFVFAVSFVSLVALTHPDPEKAKYLPEFIIGSPIVFALSWVFCRVTTGSWFPDGKIEGRLDWDRIGEEIEKGIHPKKIFGNQKSLDKFIHQK